MDVATLVANTDTSLQAVIWLGALIVLIIVASIVGYWVVRRVKSWSQTDDDTAGAFSLQRLRTMRESGEISEQEYQVMRQTILGQAAEPPPAAPNPDPDAPEDGDNPDSPEDPDQTKPDTPNPPSG